MKKTFFVFLTSILVIILHGAEITAQRIDKPPLIDGKLDDLCWQNAKSYSAFFKANAKGTAAESKTSFKVLYDDSAIYFGIRCEEPNMAELKKNQRPRDGGIYQLDCLEIMLDPASTQERYYHFMVSANNDVYDAFCEQGGGIKNAAWNGAWESGVFTGKDFWSCEIRIPFFNFTENASIGGDWKVNICRGKRAAPREDSTIAASGTYHSVGDFCKLGGIDANLDAFRLAVNPPTAKLKTGEKEQLMVENSTTVVNGRNTEATVLADSWLTAPDGKVYTSAQSKFILKPGESLGITLPQITIKDQGEYLNALRLTDQNGRVLAYRDCKEQLRFSPVSIKLITPWYRHSIFETQKIEQIEFDVNTVLSATELAGKSLELSIRNPEKIVWTSTVSPVKEQLSIKVENSQIPHGRYVISAVLKNQDGSNVDFGAAETPLWKLPYKKSETWLSRDNNIHVDGKPFFILSEWGTMTRDMPECTLYLSMSPDNIPEGQKWLCAEPIFRIIKKMTIPLQKGNLEEEHREVFREAVRKSRDSEKLVCYYLADEPSAFSLSPEGLKQAYETIKAEDPYHPVMISDAPRIEYIGACDINADHPYPNVTKGARVHDFTVIGKQYEKSLKKLAGGYHRVAFIFMDMGFNKYDYGLGPKDGRIASFDEFRGHALMALASGMKGLMPFNRNYLSYPEATIGFPIIVKEAGWLGEAVVNPHDIRPQADNANVNLIAGKKADELVIIASNVSMEPSKVTFRGLPSSLKSVNVVSEERSIPVVNGEFSDNFDSCEGHVYTSGPAPKLQSVRETKAQIEDAWAKMHKPGNLLFQRFNHQNTEATASSFKSKSGMCNQDTTMWHLFDGFAPQADNYGLIYWSSAPGQLPIWLEITPKQSAEIGRIEFYPLDKSIKDFNIELFTGGQWQKVYEQKDASSDHIVCTFQPVNAEKIRINISAINGPVARIGEIEAYAK